MKIIIDIPEVPKNDKQRWVLANGTPYAHGEWIEHKWAEEFDGHLISNYECSCCHSWKRENTDFCPNCGADMRDKKDDLVDIIEAAQSMKDRSEANG